MSTEIGWLPDLVYTGGKFEPGLAIFADGLGRIVRFSREPADLEAARRLEGQAALPGLVNGHSEALHRVLRGRAERRARPGGASSWDEALAQALPRMNGEDAYDAARMIFMEMALSGVTCAAEAHAFTRPDEVMRAAQEVGVRLALSPVAPPGGEIGPFLARMEALRQTIEEWRPSGEIWLGLAIRDLAALSRDGLKTLANYAHVQRCRLHVTVSEGRAAHDACVAAHGRSPAALLSELGVLGKRAAAIHAGAASEEDLRLLGAAKSTVCVCPLSERSLGLDTAPVARLVEAGASVCLGTGSQPQTDLFGDARTLPRPAFGPDAAAGLLHAMTYVGARSLGGPGGALEVGRPA
ncbi:MAG: amidohydrolase family protein, partial [Opitutaceae bacterium]